MPDIDRALADIVAIRTQMARQQAFCGYGPMAMAATGGLAALVALAQSFWIRPSDLAYLTTWAAAAFAAILLIGIEAVTRSRRYHSRLANEMIVAAVEDFLPAGAAGALLLIVLARFEPQALWMLPGLWQIFVGLGLFAASRALPRPVAIVAAFYLVAGIATLILGSASHALTPAMMGLPFSIGQFLLAFILFRSLRFDHDRT